MRRFTLYFIGLLLWLPGGLHAQRVVYSEWMNSNISTRYQVIGKSNDDYWVARLQMQKSNIRHITEFHTEIRNFELYDNRLHLLSEQTPLNITGMIKQWLIAGPEALDQIAVKPDVNSTRIICNHYQSNQNPESRVIDSLPFSINPSSLLMVRSGNKQYVLLLAFENTDPESTVLYIHLFDSRWNTIYRKSVSNIQFSQPCIQDDEISFPAESFDNLPIKLANNGEWGMVFPSRISHNFSVFHVCPDGGNYFFKEIPVSPFYKMEDIVMSIDENHQEMGIALLCGYRNTSLKNVQVCNYSMQTGNFDFDSSYHFNEQARDIRNKNLSHESFISVSEGGYMLLKEYGSSFEFEKPDVPPITNWESTYLLANYAEVNQGEKDNKQEYKLNRGLSPIPSVRNRGDLNLFYFPSVRGDSTWSAFMRMEQKSETNNPALSYLLLPVKKRLFVLYNNTGEFADPVATNMTLNLKGETTDDRLIFWKIDKMLNFQKAQRFALDEVAIPYLNSQRPGFAIIRLY